MQIEFDFSGFNIILWIVLIIVIIAIIFFSYKRLRQIFKRPDLYGMSKEEVKKKWTEIEGLLDKKNEVQYKMAVMEADKLLDQILKSLNYPGSTLGERLKFACHKNPRVKDVWWAHKIRNQLVHEADYRLSYNYAKKALNLFEQAFKELGVL